MPLVRVRYNPEKLSDNDIEILLVACSELVPAAFNSEQGQLTPGSIVFFAEPIGDHDLMHNDVFIEIEAYFYEDRVLNLDERTTAIHEALKERLFQNQTFAIWAKLVTAGWASDNPDPDFDGDMSMGAALKRCYAIVTAPYRP